MKKAVKKSKKAIKAIPFALKIVLFLNILAILGLLLAYTAPKISPADFWPIAFVGLLYPFLVLINVVFLIFWLFTKKRFALLSAVALMVGFTHLLNLIQINDIRKELPDSGTNIRFLTYNVRNFGLYNYHPNRELNFSYRNNIFRYLNEKEYDIIAFQEFVVDRKGEFRTLDTLTRFLDARNHHFEYTRFSRYQNYFGLATFTKFPIVNRGKIPFRTKAGNLCIYTDIAIKNDTIRVYNLHFESIGLSDEDHLFVETMTNTIASDQPENISKHSRRIYNRIRRAFIWRAAQATKVAEHIAKSPHPVILAGDFNDTPMSFAYHQIAQNLNDAFRSGRGMGRTYMIAIPGFRIDYIFHDTAFKPYNFKTESLPYSDHYPVSVVFHIPDE